MAGDNKIMKIAHLIAQFYPHVGGAEICCHNVCRTLTDGEHEAVIVTTVYDPDPGMEFPYKTECLWRRTCGILRNWPFLGEKYLHRQLARLQKKYQFDLWQVTAGYPLGIYAVDYFRKNNIPCILRCCGEDIQKFPEIDYGYRLDPGVDALVKEKYPKFDGLVALTPTVKEEYRQLGIAEEKIKIIPNGADFAKFAAARKDAEAIARIKAEFEVGDKKLILTIGRYHPKKGYDQIPEIATELKELGVEFVWVVAGKGTPVLQEKFPGLKELGVICSEDYIKSEDEDAFSLPPESLIGLFCAADIFVLPTLLETFGMVLVEAMAAGLPIVTTEAPGVKDVVADGKTGLKTPVADNVALAGKVRDVLADESLADALSANALEMAEKTYDWQVVTSQYLDFYTQIKNNQ